MLTRAAFLGLGLSVALMGALLFVVDSVTLIPYPPAQGLLSKITTDGSGQGRILNPPDWTAYTLVGMGGVTVLYAIALPTAAWKKD